MIVDHERENPAEDLSLSENGMDDVPTDIEN